MTLWLCWRQRRDDFKAKMLHQVFYYWYFFLLGALTEQESFKVKRLGQWHHDRCWRRRHCFSAPLTQKVFKSKSWSLDSSICFCSGNRGGAESYFYWWCAKQYWSIEACFPPVMHTVSICCQSLFVSFAAKLRGRFRWQGPFWIRFQVDKIHRFVKSFIHHVS